MRTALLLALVAGCSRLTPTPDAPAASPTPSARSRVVPPGERRCLPLVSGCGCAYVCAVTVHRLADGAYEVAHDLQDSRLDRVTLARWCFDAEGHGGPASGHRASHGRCIEVFEDGTPCGGECIPRTDVLRCTLVGDRCGPGP